MNRRLRFGAALNYYRSVERSPMGKINLGRVILGGLVAGLIINVFEGVMNGVIMADQWADVMASLNRPTTPSIKTIIALNVWGFALGIITVWLYAAIRPRFGPGPKTALCAGLFVWATACAMASAVPVFMKIYKVDVALIAVGVELVEMALAGVVGGFFYKEDAAGDFKSQTARV
jgi:hypothetical protein